MTLKVCQVVASINREVGGPAVTVPRLAQALSEVGVESTLFTLNYPSLGEQTILPGYQLHSVEAGWVTRKLRGWNPRFRRELELGAGSVSLVHNHGLWMAPNLYARQAAARAGVPLVISPRGMLEDWSLQHRRLKKTFFRGVFEQRNLTSAAMFHATSAAEAESIRRLGFRQPIALIPNGIDLPFQTTKREMLETDFPELAEKKWLLFLGRLHPKKGLLLLLNAWSQIRDEFPDWHLVVAGPDLDGYGEIMRQKSRELSLGESVTFTGMLSGARKESALANAGLFVLPTFSENFGLAVGEALSYGIPAVTTTAAPWPELVERNCGWWIANEPETLRETLRTALALPASKLREMGAKGRAFMQERYSWRTVGEEMKQSYRWLTGKEERPACLVS